MPEALSSLALQPLPLSPPQAGSAAPQPDGAQSADSAQPGGQVLPELALAAVSDTPAGGAANYPPNAADKDIMQADGTMDNTGAGAADDALPLQLPLPASAAAQAQAPVDVEGNVVALRPGGAKISSPKISSPGQGRTMSSGLAQQAAQAGRAEGSTLELVKSTHDLSTSPAQAGVSGAADQISAPLLSLVSSAAGSNEQVAAGVVTAHTVAPATQQANPAPVNAPVSLQLPLSLEQRGWGESLGYRVLWMVKQDHQIAELQLNPPHLGPLELRVTVEQDEASIAFSTQHAGVRDALETALPRLREMLGASGLILGQVNISQQSFAEQRESRYGGNDHPRGAVSSGDAVMDETPSISLLRPSDGVIDLYA